MSEKPKSLLTSLFSRVFPATPDFFEMLMDQSIQVTKSVERMVEYMETGDAEIGKMLKQDEHEADIIKVRNIHALNEAFSTPIDREDIYRAIMDLDEVVSYCKTTVSEMYALDVTPDDFMREMSNLVLEGAKSLAGGFAKLSKTPALAALDADAVRKAERHIEKIYRHALPALLQGDDYINMFKRREIYRHLAYAGEHMAACANTLHDIVVKIS